MDVIKLRDKFAKFSDHWHPRIVAELNGQQVKLAKLLGEFSWHFHEHEDEMFFVVSGELTMKLRPEHGGDRIVRPGEFIVVPRGVEHCPVASLEVQIMLFEPASTQHTGNMREVRTRDQLEWI